MPCAELDLLIEDNDGAEIIEISRKLGRYDRRARARIAVRRRHPGMDLARAVALRWSEDPDRLVLSVVDVVSLDVLWTAVFRRLSTVCERASAPRIVRWHATRYYRMLGEDAVIAATTAVESGPWPMTITAANRLASRALYSEAVALGWRKLTARQQERLGLTGQWHSEAMVRGAYARLGERLQTIGDWTLDAAAGPEAAIIAARPWRSDDDAEDVA